MFDFLREDSKVISKCYKIKEYGRKLQLMWHFRNDERLFLTDRFRPKSSFNPRNKEVIIETYISCSDEQDIKDIKILKMKNRRLCIV